MHGIECATCGYTQTAHDFPDQYPGACSRYKLPEVIDLPLMLDEMQRRIPNVVDDREELGRYLGAGNG